MALNSREQKILWVTTAVVLTAGIWVYGIQPLYGDYEDLENKLETEQATYSSNRKTLSTAPKIESDFKRIEAAFPQQDKDKQPEFQFSEDVVNLAEQILHSKPKEVGTVQSEPMKDVTGYEFLTFNIRISGELKNIAELLKAFDQKGFLIKSIVLTSNNIDNPELQLNITLARVVKVEPDDSTQGGGLRGKRRLNSSGGRK